jgi:isocitrate dehydrogenase
MKQTDGLFHKVFDEIGAEYKDIEQEHWIVDIGAAKLADTPEAFDVIVTLNLYGDILSDVAAQIAGSVGLAGSANIGTGAAMFEAIHGSAPRRAGQNLANPSGLLLGAVMMLVHIDQPDIAERVHNGWLRTLEDGVHTYDIYDERVSQQKVGTKEFAQAVVDRLGKKPETLKAVAYKPAPPKKAAAEAVRAKGEPRKDMVGIDVFLQWAPGNPAELGTQLEKLGGPDCRLTMLSNRGVKVYPGGFAETFLSDNWRCRFFSNTTGKPLTHRQICGLLQRISDAGLDFIKTESLCNFDGQRAYSLDQGE